MTGSISIRAQNHFTASVGRMELTVIGGKCAKHALSQLRHENIDSPLPLAKSLEGKLDGSFAFCIKSSNETVIAVDRARTIPLFYSVTYDKLTVSDSKISEGTSFSTNALNQIFAAGFVLGRDTLFAEMKQVEAGQMVQFLVNEGKVETRLHDYFRFCPQATSTTIESDAAEKLWNITMAACRNSIDEAAGQKILLPLSGGMDSRLILIVLKKLGVDVTTYTYGALGSKEVEISRKVANEMGVEWHRVEYSRPKWRSWSQSDSFSSFLEFAGDSASLPCIQEFGALAELQSKLGSSYTVISGYSGDFIAGSHVPRDLISSPTVISKQSVVERITKNTSIFNSHLQPTPIARH